MFLVWIIHKYIDKFYFIFTNPENLNKNTDKLLMNESHLSKMKEILLLLKVATVQIKPKLKKTLKKKLSACD